MSERRRIVIKKRWDPSGRPELTLNENQLEPMQPSSQEAQAVGPSSDEDAITRAHKIYEELMEKIAEIRRRDHVIQKIFQRMDTIDFKIVKKKIDEINAQRSELLSSLGEVEVTINEAINQLENSMALHEEELFDKLVELEVMRDMEREGKQVDRLAMEEAEKEASRLRSAISSIRQKIVDFQKKLEEVRSLNAKLVDVTTSKEVAESLYRDLLAKFKDEAKIRPLVDKFAQEESVPREYAVIYLWKKVFKPSVAEPI